MSDSLECRYTLSPDNLKSLNYNSDSTEFYGLSSYEEGIPIIKFCLLIPKDNKERYLKIFKLWIKEMKKDLITTKGENG